MNEAFMPARRVPARALRAATAGRGGLPLISAPFRGARLPFAAHGGRP